MGGVMEKNEKCVCVNIYKNQDVETRKKKLAKILAEIINHQLRIKKYG